MVRLNVFLFTFLALTIRVSTLEGNLRCGNFLLIWVDGSYIGDSPYTQAKQINIPDESQMLSIMCFNDYPPAGILASFDNGVVSDSSWRCSPTLQPSWFEISFDDSQWSLATELGTPGSKPWGAVKGVSSSARWIWNDLSSPELFCRKALASAVEEDDGEVTPEGCKYRGVIHPAGETWIQEVSVDPQRQSKCTCPDPLPTTWSASTGGCTAACVKEDGIVHSGGDQYQRTIDDVLTECSCNRRGRERCE